MKETHFYFPLHLDAGNRGCEAIAKGTIQLLGINKHEYIALRKKAENDKIVGLSGLVTYFPAKESRIYESIRRLLFRVKNKLRKDAEKKRYYLYRYIYDPFINTMENGALTFITGGDMLCYGNNEINYITDRLFQKNIKTILWGCSVGEENLTPEKIEALQKYSLITARESLTYDLMIHTLKLKNVKLFPDPAFILKPEKVSLSDCFKKACVGINLSVYVTANADLDTMCGRNIVSLIQYIITNTDYNVVMIPHVFWDGQDDRIICKSVEKYFYNTQRVYYIDTEELNYCQIRYIISKCRYFLGARTHAMISAYSTKVPSIALGYSVKSKGIAKDLNMPDFTILDYRNLAGESDITERFIKLEEYETEIRETYESVLTSYIKEIYEAKKCIEELQGRMMND